MPQPLSGPASRGDRPHDERARGEGRRAACQPPPPAAQRHRLPARSPRPEGAPQPHNRHRLPLPPSLTSSRARWRRRPRTEPPPAGSGKGRAREANGSRSSSAMAAAAGGGKARPPAVTGPACGRASGLPRGRRGLAVSGVLESPRCLSALRERIYRFYTCRPCFFTLWE